MAWAFDSEMPLHRHSHKINVAHKVKQLVTHGLIGEVWDNSVEDTVFDIDAILVLAEKLRQTFFFVIAKRFVDKYQCIVQIAALYEIERKQYLHFVQEDKSAAAGKIVLILGV